MQIINKPCCNNNLNEHAKLLISSYRHWTGKDLIGQDLADSDASHSLYLAPYGVVSHNTEDDPVFNYGNQTALDLFEMSWLEFTKLPSKNSAEPVNRMERENLLARVSKYGYINDYRGIRISSSGKRFMIENATIWNIVDNKNHYYGQAAVFYQWSALTF